MFDFQKLEVYKKSRFLYREIGSINITTYQHKHLRNQLLRALSSITLNIAEGSGKYSKRDKKNFYTIARASTYECVAIVDLLYDVKVLSKEKYGDCISQLTEVSKMLLGLIRSMNG